MATRAYSGRVTAVVSTVTTLTRPQPGYAQTVPYREQRRQESLYANSLMVIVPSAGTADTTPPGVNVLVLSADTVSTVEGWDDTLITWTTDEDCQAWQIQVVVNAADTVDLGVLVVSGGSVMADTQTQTQISGSMLPSGDGAKLMKIFCQDIAGNWSN